MSWTVLGNKCENHYHTGIKILYAPVLKDYYINTLHQLKFQCDLQDSM